MDKHTLRSPFLRNQARSQIQHINEVSEHSVHWGINPTPSKTPSPPFCQASLMFTNCPGPPF